MILLISDYITFYGFADANGKASVSFNYDGENVANSKTPIVLDMENDDIIDAKVSYKYCI